MRFGKLSPRNRHSRVASETRVGESSIWLTLLWDRSDCSLVLKSKFNLGILVKIMTLRSVNDLLKSKTWRGVPLSLSSLALDFFLLTPPCTQASMKSEHVQLNSKRQPGALPSGSAWTWWPTLVWLLQRSPAECFRVKVMKNKFTHCRKHKTKKPRTTQTLARRFLSPHRVLNVMALVCPAAV